MAVACPSKRCSSLPVATSHSCATLPLVFGMLILGVSGNHQRGTLCPNQLGLLGSDDSVEVCCPNQLLLPVTSSRLSGEKATAWTSPTSPSKYGNSCPVVTS